MATIKEDYDEAIVQLGESNSEISYISDIWSDLTASGKTAQKQKHSTLIDDAITKLTAVKNRINSL